MNLEFNYGRVTREQLDELFNTVRSCAEKAYAVIPFDLVEKAIELEYNYELDDETYNIECQQIIRQYESAMAPTVAGLLEGLEVIDAFSDWLERVEDDDHSWWMLPYWLIPEGAPNAEVQRKVAERSCLAHGLASEVTTLGDRSWHTFHGWLPAAAYRRFVKNCCAMSSDSTAGHFISHFHFDEVEKEWHELSVDACQQYYHELLQALGYYQKAFGAVFNDIGAAA